MLADVAPPRQTWRREILDAPLATLLLSLSVLFVAFLYPKVVSDFVLTDFLIGATIIASMLHTFRGDWRARDVARQIAVPIWVIGIGALVGSLYAGLRAWIVGDLVRDVATILVFLSAIDILRRGGPRATRMCFAALGIALVAAAVQLGTSGGDELRASGTFPNPNVAGNLLAMGLLCWSAAPFRTGTKLAVGGVAVIGLLSAASFGSMLQLGVGFGYLGLTHVDQARNLMRGRRLLAVIPLLLLALVAFFAFTQLRGGQDKSGFNQARFDRSGGLRVAVWEEAIRKVPDAPWGVGPGSVRGLDLNTLETELHSEPLAFLVERGVIGLFGLFLMWFALLRLCPRGTQARAMVLAYIFGSFFRETWHYRHFWLFLPMALVAAEQARRFQREEDEVVLT